MHSIRHTVSRLFPPAPDPATAEQIRGRYICEPDGNDDKRGRASGKLGRSAVGPLRNPGQSPYSGDDTNETLCCPDNTTEGQARTSASCMRPRNANVKRPLLGRTSIARGVAVAPEEPQTGVCVYRCGCRAESSAPRATMEPEKHTKHFFLFSGERQPPVREER